MRPCACSRRAATCPRSSGRRSSPTWCWAFSAPRPRGRARDSEGDMKLYYFSEMPHHEYPDAEGDKYPSLRLAFPNTFFSPDIAHRNYQRYLDEYEHADQAGF